MSDPDRPAKDWAQNREAKPAPPPQRRQSPLPWQSLKPATEDAAAPQLVARIMAQPNYRPADKDPDFLASDVARGPRLELDYLKAETGLRAHGICHTIVVFGSTRVREARAAEARLAEAQKEAQANPDDPKAAQALAIAERIVEKVRFYDIAREFGGIVSRAQAAHEVAHPPGPEGPRRLAVVTGGGPGIMEAANRGAFDVGAATVGLNIQLPHEQYPNPYITPELCFQFHYFAIRKLHFLLRARALVVFPGGYGTLDELFESLMLIQTRKIEPMPVVLVGEAWWRQAFDPDFLVAEGVIDPEDRDLFWYCESAEEIWRDINRWYEQAGKPLMP